LNKIIDFFLKKKKKSFIKIKVKGKFYINMCKIKYSLTQFQFQLIGKREITIINHFPKERVIHKEIINKIKDKKSKKNKAIHLNTSLREKKSCYYSCCLGTKKIKQSLVNN